MSEMVASIVLMSVWVIAGNFWHFILLVQRKGNNRPKTISEHAVESSNLLITHRVVHSFPLIVFIPVVVGYLVPNGYTIAALLLFAGAIFDSLEALTLNKKSAPIDSAPNSHYISAWLMALSYLGYALIISRIAGVSSWVYCPILTLCGLLAVLAQRGILNRVSLAMQMSYFILLSLVVLIANASLITS